MIDSLKQMAIDFSVSRMWQVKLFIMLDFCFAIISVFLAVRLSPYSRILFNPAHSENMWIFAPTFATGFLFAGFVVGLYDRRCFESVSASLVQSMAAAVIASLVTIVVLYLVEYQIVGRYVLVLCGTIATVFATASRWFVRDYIGHTQSRIFLFGDDAGRKLLQSELDRIQWHSVIVRVVPPDWSFRDPSLKTIKLCKKNCFPVCTIADILVADAECSKELMEMIMNCSVCGMHVADFVSYYEESFEKLPLEKIGFQWVMAAKSSMTRPLGRAIKRATDVIIATVCLILVLPLWAVIVPAIKLTSRGPVFFRQERLGRGKRIFKIIKFRSMINDAESSCGAVWCNKRDERITAVGKLLRMTRLDETPQFVNVLKGEMSMVGPRPERPEFWDGLVDNVKGYELRSLMKPGITGWAQVMYSYGACEDDAKEKLRFDLYYVKNATFFFDLRILIATIGSMVRGAR